MIELQVRIYREIDEGDYEDKTIRNVEFLHRDIRRKGDDVENGFKLHTESGDELFFESQWMIEEIL